VRLEPGAFNSAIERFEFVRKLGQGSFGAVWLAQDSGRGEKVAVKFLNVNRSTPGDVEAFKREFEILSELKQVHLARMFDFGFSPEKEQYFLTTEFCPGKKLLEALDGKPPAYFEEILVQLLAALECIHSQGIIHFDIKPENILVEDKDGRPDVKLVDFGVAVRLQAIPEQLGGTLAFVAPEVLERSAQVDHRVDLYSLGMVSLMCLTKRLPFTPGNTKEMVDWHRSGELRDKLWEGVEAPRYLREVTEKLLAKNPSERFSNSRVVLNFLNLATGGKYRRAEEELPAEIPVEGPLVERRKELIGPLLEQIGQKFGGKQAEQEASLRFITGEKGIGKSRVLDEIQHFLQLKEIPFLKLECDENEPTWPILERWVGAPSSGEDELNEAWQTRRRADALLQAGEKRPFCLLIDEFQKADHELKALIASLEGQSLPFFVLIATEEEREGNIPIPRLSQEGISQYVKLILGDSLPVDHLSEVLFRYSGGLPMLMVEGLRFLAPHFFRGEKLDGLLRSKNIRILYEKRIRQLNPEEEELLLILALLFRPVTEAELVKILDLESGEVVDRAGRGFKLGLIGGNLYGEAQFRVSSQALASELLANIDPGTQTRLHRSIARGLLRLGKASYREIAYHLGKAGEIERAVEYYQKAGISLQEEGKISLAVDCFTRAAELMRGGSSEWQGATLKIFHFLVLSGSYREAEHCLESLEAYPSWERDKTAGWLYYKLRKFPEARRCYSQALQEIPEHDRFRRILIENAVGNIDLQEGKFQDAVLRFQKTLEWENELPQEERLELNSKNNLGLALSQLGQHEDAVRFFEQRLASADSLNVEERLMLLNGIGFACLKASRNEETISYLKKAVILEEDSGAYYTLFSTMGNLLTVFLKENRYDEALLLLQKIENYQRRFGTRKDIAHNLLRRGSVYLMLGMGEFARDCLQEGHQISREISEGLLSGWFSLMMAYWEWDFGRSDRAEEKFLNAEREGSEAGNAELRSLARYGLADLCFELRKVEECRANLNRVSAQKQDHEFEIRLRLLQAKINNEVDSSPLFSALEKECLENHYRELLWEVYYAWGKSLLSHKEQKNALLML